MFFYKVQHTLNNPNSSDSVSIDKANGARLPFFLITSLTWDGNWNDAVMRLRNFLYCIG
jgi:hypothetical protein